MKKILLIGGNGVLGSTYVENFINNTNYKIVVLDLDNPSVNLTAESLIVLILIDDFNRESLRLLIDISILR